VGDGLLLGSPPSWSKGMVETTLALLEHEGRSRADYGLEAMVDFSFGPERWAEEIRAWQDLGGTHLTLRAMDVAIDVVGGKRMEYRGPQDYIDALRAFKQETGL
jgi:hypothetical protein